MKEIFKTKGLTFCVDENKKQVEKPKGNGMIHISLDLYSYQESKDYKEDGLIKLGITYEHYIPQSINDSIWYLNCKDVPEELPEYLTRFELTEEAYQHWTK